MSTKFDSNLYRKLSVLVGIIALAFGTAIIKYTLSLPPSPNAIANEDIRIALFLGFIFGAPAIGMILYSLYLNFEITIGDRLRVKNSALLGRIDAEIAYEDIQGFSFNAFDSLKIELKSGDVVAIPKYVIVQRDTLTADKLAVFESLDKKQNMQNIKFLEVLLRNKMS